MICHVRTMDVFTKFCAYPVSREEKLLPCWSYEKKCLGIIKVVCVGCILWELYMPVWDFRGVCIIVVETFHKKKIKCQTHTHRGIVRGSPKLIGFIPWGPWISSQSDRQTIWHTNSVIPRADGQRMVEKWHKINTYESVCVCAHMHKREVAGTDLSVYVCLSEKAFFLWVGVRWVGVFDFKAWRNET